MHISTQTKNIFFRYIIILLLALALLSAYSIEIGNTIK